MIGFYQTWAILIGLFIVNGVIGFIFYRRQLMKAMGEVADLLTNIFEKRPVKHAMSMMGKASGESKQHSAMVDDIALNVLNSPQIGKYKGMLKLAGIDLDAMIEDEGAPATIKAIKDFGDMMGIDIMQLITQGLNSTTADDTGVTSQSQNPYL